MAHRPPSVQFDISTLGIIPLLTDSSQPDWASAIPPATERVLKYWGRSGPALESASPMPLLRPIASWPERTAWAFISHAGFNLLFVDLRLSKVKLLLGRTGLQPPTANEGCRTRKSDHPAPQLKIRRAEFAFILQGRPA